VRAREPDVQGYVDRDGVKVAYDSFGAPAAGKPTVVFVPIDMITHSRAWKAQVPFLSRFAHVVTIDPRGNGRSDRPEDPSAYDFREYVGDTVAVMDALGVERAVLAGVCVSAYQALLVAALHPDRVQGVVAFGPWANDDVPRYPPKLEAAERFRDQRDDDDGWAKLNEHYWRRDWRGFAEFFFNEICPEPHSTKVVEDMVAYACESTPETQLMDLGLGPWPETAEQSDELLRSIRCPVLVVHGTEDRCQVLARGARVAEVTGGTLVTLHG
jgi:pimeloyl-ACP methyl ester carboxylesterase